MIQTRKRDIEPHVLATNVSFMLWLHVKDTLDKDFMVPSPVCLLCPFLSRTLDFHNPYMCLVKSAGEGASKICFKAIKQIVDKKLGKFSLKTFLFYSSRGAHPSIE